MAHSPSSTDRRANLIREMARQSDRSRSRGSNASSCESDGASVPDFDTESRQLSALPGSTPHHPASQSRENEYQINTSALKRAFPDFSQDGSSDEDSVEFGRGISHDQTVQSEGTSEDISLDLGVGGQFRVTGTPPVKPKRTKSLAEDAMKNAASKRLTSEKENQDPLKQHNESNPFRNVHGANVDDKSISINQDVSRTKGKTKNTRFAKSRNLQPLGESKSNANVKPADQGGQDATLNSINSANKGTYQSFMLPDLPNITELVSGVRQDGTPLFSRSGKSRSRIGSSSASRQQRDSRTRHIPIDDMPVPADEKALFLSLQILQEKVKSLETEKSQSDKRAEEYELEVLQLRSKLEESDNLRHSDSGLGFDAEEEKTKEWENEKSRFEVSIKSLQKRLDRVTKKVSTSENEIESLKNDRDAAQQQLAIAYISSEELQKEDEGVRGDLQRVKSQLAKVTRQHERRVEKLAQQEAELRQKIGRRGKAVKEMSVLAKELWNTRNAIASVKGAEQNVTPSQRERSEPPKRKGSPSCKSSHLFSVDSGGVPRGSRLQVPSSKPSERNKSRPPPRSVASLANDPYDSDADSTTHLDLSGLHGYDMVKDDSYLSFMEGDEVSKLKKILEQDKAQLAKYGAQPPQQESDFHPGAKKPAPPRKSSLKRLSTRSKRGHVQYKDQDLSEPVSINDKQSPRRPNSRSRVVRDDNPLSVEFKLNASEENRKHETVTSQKTETRRPRSSQDHTENMTSALILPDITLSDAGIDGQTQAHHSGTADHKDKPLVSKAPETSKTNMTTVPRPVPVTSRPPPSEVSDPTLRPAQFPSVALATVLHTLQTELASLRSQFARQEALYRQHDPALSKRKRKSVCARMRKLLTRIEMRSDQIYALYDVLEGQKVAGCEMQEQEVEVTLERVGLGRERIGKGAQEALNGKNDDGSESGESDGDEDGDDDEGLDDAPWEGFENTNTATQTLEGLRVLGARIAA